MRGMFNPEAGEPRSGNALAQDLSQMSFEEAQRLEREGGTPEQERQARAAGFDSYMQMRYYMMQRSRKTGGTEGGQPSVDGVVGRDSGDGRSNALSWHPQQLLGYVKRKWDEAMN